jgi:hypothetical protein
MQDFPANSQKAKETAAPAREPLKPVTSATTGGKRKRGLGRQFRSTFLGGSARDAGEYMVADVVVPAIRDMLYDALQSGLDRLIYGERASGKSRSSSIVSPNLGHFAYESITKPTKATQQHRTLSKQGRARFDLAELIIPTKEEANEVIDQMFTILSQGGDVTVADLYTLTGVRPDHTDTRYGWYSLKGSRAVRDRRRGGFILDLPDPEPLG